MSGSTAAAELTFLGLYALQHRGQESAGIVSIDEGGTSHAHRSMGLVADVFDDNTIRGLKGSVAIGHVRYSTAGGSQLRNAQPMLVDYRREASNMVEMERLHADVPEVVIPRVVEEASARNVLTMEYVGGIAPDEACSERQPRELRDRWGQVLFEFEFRGLFRHRLLHADPNLANFAFLEDGRVVVYDHGCLKRVSPEIARGYARLMLAAAERRKSDVPGALRDMGVHKSNGEPLAAEVTDPYVDLCAEIVRERPPYTFGENKHLYRDLWNLGLANMSEAADLRFPRDVVFIDRTLGGHFGNLSRLRATGPWRELLMKYVRPVAEKEV